MNAVMNRLHGLWPPRTLFVAESGINTRDDLEAMRAAGASAVLIGEGLLRAVDPASIARPRHYSTHSRALM